jgi:DNA-binding transcriptional LysR family regulator
MTIRSNYLTLIHRWSKLLPRAFGAACGGSSARLERIMSIRNLRTLVAIKDQGSFAAASESLGLTHSAVSMQVKMLEETYGARLFDRSERPPRLTEPGDALIQHAREVLALYDGLAGVIGTGSAIHGMLKVGVIPTALTGIAPRVLAELRRVYPSLQIQLSSAMSGDLLDMVRRNELDVALQSEPFSVPKDLEWTRVLQQKVVVVAPPRLRARRDVQVLNAWPYIRFNRRSWVAPLIAGALRERGLDLEQSMELDSLEAIYMMVQAGLGVSIIPDGGPFSPFRPDVRILPFGPPQIERWIGFLSKKAPLKDKTIAALIDAASAALG